MFQCPRVAFKYVQKASFLVLNCIHIQGLVSTHRNKVLKWYAVSLSFPRCLFHRVLDTCRWLLNKSQSQSSASGELCFFIRRATNWLFRNCPHLLFAIPWLHLEFFVHSVEFHLFVLKRMLLLPKRLNSRLEIKTGMKLSQCTFFYSSHLMTSHFKRTFEWLSWIWTLSLYICNCAFSRTVIFTLQWIVNTQKIILKMHFWIYWI